MTKSLCIQINDVANRLLPTMSPAQMNVARADLRRIADLAKELELSQMARLAQSAEAAETARLDAQRVVRVQFPQRIAVHVVGDRS